MSISGESGINEETVEGGWHLTEQLGQHELVREIHRIQVWIDGHFLEAPPSWIQTTLKEDQLWLHIS